MKLYTISKLTKFYNAKENYYDNKKFPKWL